MGIYGTSKKRTFVLTPSGSRWEAERNPAALSVHMCIMVTIIIMLVISVSSSSNSVYIYIYIYTHINIHTCVYILILHTHIYIYIYIYYTHINIHTCIRPVIAVPRRRPERRARVARRAVEGLRAGDEHDVGDIRLHMCVCIYIYIYIYIDLSIYRSIDMSIFV